MARIRPARPSPIGALPVPRRARRDRPRAWTWLAWDAPFGVPAGAGLVAEVRADLALECVGLWRAVNGWFRRFDLELDEGDAASGRRRADAAGPVASRRGAERV